VSPRSGDGAVNRIAENAPGTWMPKLLLEQNDWKDAFTRLDGMTTLGPAERLFYKALILDVCSFYPDAVRGQDPRFIAAIQSGTLEEYAARLTAPMKDPRQKAAAAFTLQRNVAHACKGFRQAAVSKAEVAKAYADAAEAGDLKAQARLLHLRQAQTATADLERKDGRPAGFSDPMTPAERDLLLDTMFTGDPIAIRVASQALSLGTFQQSLRFGPDRVDLGEHSAEIWTLVACEFGLECGARNMAVTNACGQLGQCADDFPGYLRDFALNSVEFEFARRTARSIAEAIRQHDRDAFRLVPHPGQAITSLTTDYVPPIAIR
jgi:hypothetical protein